MNAFSAVVARAYDFCSFYSSWIDSADNKVKIEKFDCRQKDTESAFNLVINHQASACYM